MSEETETGTQTFDCSCGTIELRLRQETEMEPALDGTPADELTLRSLDKGIKQATDPILRRVEELSALLGSRTEMESGDNSEASGSRRNREFSSPSRKRYDSQPGIFSTFMIPIKERIYKMTPKTSSASRQVK